MEAFKKIGKLFFYQRLLGILLVLAGIPTIIMDSTSGSEMPLMLGLFILLFAGEKKEDERSSAIRAQSLAFAFVIGYAFKLVTSNLFFRQIITWQLVEINHFIILIFSVTLMIYYLRMYVLK